MLNGWIGQVLADSTDITVPVADIKIKPPRLEDIMAFGIRLLFIVAGLAALLYLLLGAIAWITSGGNKENVESARNKIMHAVIGLILIFVVLAVFVTLEQILFPGNCGLGVLKQICIPGLVEPKP